MEMAKYTDKFLEQLKLKGLNYTSLGKMLGLHSTTVSDKLKSKNVTTIIEMLNILGLKVVDENGVDITTEEKIFQKAKGDDMILIGNRYFSKEEIKELKEVIENIDND
jgi:alcohol dehydrogenase class IV